MKTSTAPSTPTCCTPKRRDQETAARAGHFIAGKWKKTDKPLLVIVLIVLAIAALAPGQLPASLVFTGQALATIGPWLALAALLAAYAKVSNADSVVARSFTGHPARSIAMASLVGALSPFCSCGVVPIIAGLLGAGVPLAPVMAFWMSSPLMDPNMFVVTAATLGTEFALVKTAAAIGMGVFSGMLTHGMTARTGLSQALRHVHASSTPLPASTRPQWNILRSPAARRAFTAGAVSNGWLLLRWMTVAFLLESLMTAYIPAKSVLNLLGQETSAIPLAVLVGIPAYLNGFAALPLVSGLVDMGMSPAVALAFLVSGGVTSIPAATAVWALVRPRLFAWYVLLAITGALLTAYTYRAFLALS